MDNSILSPAGIDIEVDGLEGKETTKGLVDPKFSTQTVLDTVGNCIVSTVTEAVDVYMKGTPDTWYEPTWLSP